MYMYATEYIYIYIYIFIICVNVEKDVACLTSYTILSDLTKLAHIYYWLFQLKYKI